MPEFTCERCGSTFTLPQAVLDRYPGWTPRLCGDCHDATKGGERSTAAKPSRSRSSAGSSQLLTTDQVLARYTEGPSDGVFTDGGSVPNPGPGGWGAVYVVGGELVAEEHGSDPDTTNNRMELTALIRGSTLVPEGVATTVYTDSNLAMRTINEWAAGWEQRGWRRKSGPVENLDLVQEAYGIYRVRPELRIEWIAAHSGFRWNEYADALASRWRLPDA